MEEPQFFGILDAEEVEPGKWLVAFGVRSVEQPGTEPIALYFQEGIRKYVWRDKFWSECDYPYHLWRSILAGVRQRDPARAEAVMKMVAGYKLGCGPSNRDTIDQGDQSVTFYRVMFEVPG